MAAFRGPLPGPPGGPLESWPPDRGAGAAGGEDGVQSTHVDAALAKVGCAKLGYFEDKWTELLIRNTRPIPRSPLIHRGYYSRVAAMRSATTRFLERCPEGRRAQIVSLGAGLDTTYFWLRESRWWREDLVYFEVDFPEVLSKKLSAIIRKQTIWPLLDATTKEELVGDELGPSGTRELRTPHCRFVSTDMRICPELADAMVAAGLRSDVPTLFLSECVLVYMQSMHGDSLIEWASAAVPGAPVAFAMYEQTNPDDPFGQMMVQNLAQRGCPLLSIYDYPTMARQRERFLARGWTHCSIVDMNEVYDRHLDPADVARVHRIELMDEFEEWHLIQAHYFVAVATREELSPGAAAEGAAAAEAGGEGAGAWVRSLHFPPRLAPGGVDAS